MTNLSMNIADAFDFFHLATARPICIGLLSWPSPSWSCLCSEFIYIPNLDGLFAPPPGCGRRLIVGRPAVDPGLGLRTSPPLRMCRLVFAGVLHLPSGGPSAFGQDLPTCQWGPLPLFILSWSLSPSRRIFMRRSLPLITSEAGEACVFIAFFSIAFIVF